MFRLYLVYQSVDSALQMRPGSLSGVQGPVPWNLAWRFGWKTRAMSVYNHLVQRIETSLSLASSKWLSINLKFVCGGNQWGQFQKNDLQRYYRCFHMYFEDLNQTGLIVSNCPNLVYVLVSNNYYWINKLLKTSQKCEPTVFMQRQGATCFNVFLSSSGKGQTASALDPQFW